MPNRNPNYQHTNLNKQTNKQTDKQTNQTKTNYLHTHGNKCTKKQEEKKTLFPYIQAPHKMPLKKQEKNSIISKRTSPNTTSKQGKEPLFPNIPHQTPL